VSQVMVPVEMIGLKADLAKFLAALRDLGCVQIDPVSDSPEVLARPLTLDAETLLRQEEAGVAAARIDNLLETLGSRAAQPANPGQVGGAPDLVSLRQAVDDLHSEVQDLIDQNEKLQGELAYLPLYETILSRLAPLAPASAHQPGNVMVGVLVNRASVAVLDMVTRQVLEISQGTASMVSSDVYESSRALLIVIHQDYLPDVEALLGQTDVSRLNLPPELGKGLPSAMLATIHRRLREIPAEQGQIEDALSRLARQWLELLMGWKRALEEEAEGWQVCSRLGETDMTFILTGWIPRKDLARARERLVQETGGALVIRELPFTPEMKDRAPVIQDNLPAARPFEGVVGLFDLPRYQRIDPTGLVAVFFPIFFGLMLGDIGYGLLILATCLILLRRFRSGTARSLTIAVAAGSGWAIVFGVLFGEMFGALGEELGLRPLWFERGSAEHVMGYLILAAAIGGAHVSLGLVLGLVEASRDRSRTHLLGRGGRLLGLISLFALVGVLVDVLPRGFMTPSVAGVIVGIVLLSASLGWIGILMGPIEFLGLIGNVLSYLRIAAIGLASVYLAKVANEMACLLGNLVVGLIVAALLHALNLVLGAFSPSIHSLRLHYVEFFQKFYEGGGKPYEPFQSRRSIAR